MPMPLRSLRIEDELWRRAIDRATRDGVSLSAMIREWLEVYANGDEDLIRNIHIELLAAKDLGLVTDRQILDAIKILKEEL